MVFVYIGLLVFISTFVFAPVFDWTLNIYRNVYDCIGEHQADLFRSMPNNQFRVLAVGVFSVMAGLLLALGFIFVCGWLINSYMDDGLMKGILIMSFGIGALLMPISFAIQVRVIFDTWLNFRKETAVISRG